MLWRYETLKKLSLISSEVREDFTSMNQERDAIFKSNENIRNLKYGRKLKTKTIIRR